MRKIISVISIVLLSFQVCFSQSVRFESIVVNGAKIKFDNVEWKFQKEESFTRSNLDPSDSADIINLLLNVEKNNPGFHIPTSTELFLMNKGTATYPETKIKCNKKFFSCKEINNGGWSILLEPGADPRDAALFLFNHRHPCKNCQSASKEYKKICPVCKGTNQSKSYCNKLEKCPKCKGTGYYFSEEQKVPSGFVLHTLGKEDEDKQNMLFAIRPANSLSVEIPWTKLLSVNDVFFYFNSISDFGLYDIKNSYKLSLLDYPVKFEVAILAGEQQIESSIKKHKIFQEEDNKVSTVILKTIKDCDFTKARNQISKLNFPDKFPYYADLKNKEDSVLISKIGLDLINISPIEAANKFKDLDRGHKEFKRLKEEIQNSLNEYSKNVKDTINKQAFDKFVKENAESLTQLPLGKHILKSNNNGRYLIDNNTEKIYLGKLDQISELKYGDFVVKIPSEKSFEITTSIEKTGNWIYATRQWRNLYKNNYNNKLYRREFKNCSSFATVYDRKCPRNRVFVIQPQKYVTHIETSFDKPYAENFSIAIAEEQAEPKIMEKIKIHRKFHIGTLGMMTILMAVPSYWMISRELEIKNIQ